MERLDAAILDRVERFCHWFQRLTGLTNCWWAKVSFGSLVFFPLFFFMATVNDKRSNDPFPLDILGISIAGIALLGSAYLFAMAPDVEQAEEHYRTSNGVAHHMTLFWRSMWGPRMAHVMMAVPAIVGISFIFHWSVWGILASFAVLESAAVSSFLAVIPLPPSTSKIRQWADDIAEGLKPALKPLPISVPSSR